MRQFIIKVRDGRFDSGSVKRLPLKSSVDFLVPVQVSLILLSSLLDKRLGHIVIGNDLLHNSVIALDPLSCQFLLPKKGIDLLLSVYLGGWLFGHHLLVFSQELAKLNVTHIRNLLIREI